MSKENFKVTSREDGKEYWISRALAVVGCIFTVTKEKEVKFLFEIRGKGCPDNVGKMAFPCGYLNWDETLEEAVRREIFEELGLNLDKSEIIKWKLVDDPKADARQNVVVRFAIYCTDLEQQLPQLKEFIKHSEDRGGESDEVSELLLLDVNEINETPDECFAFGHKTLVSEFMEGLINADKEDENEDISPSHSTLMD